MPCVPRTVATQVLLFAALFSTLTGSAPPATFPLLTASSAWAAAVCLLLPTLVFAAADVALDEKAWRWLGPTHKHARSTSELERRGAVVLHPMNAYSSHAQTAAGGFILARACTDASVRGPLASGAYGLTMLLMGVIRVRVRVRVRVRGRLRSNDATHGYPYPYPYQCPYPYP